MLEMNAYNFNGKKALIRVDYNVPLNDRQQVTDDTRIRASLPTIKKVLADGGSVILMSHLGRPKGKAVAEMSMKPIAAKLEELLDGQKVILAKDSVGDDAAQKAKNLKPGEILLLENLRFHNEEEAGDKAFAEKLSKLGDVYINDAYGTAHREHASTAVVAQYFPQSKMFGYLMDGEVKNIEKVLKESEKPFTAIVGGAKVSDKVGIIENLLEKADNILIGGAMAYTFIKANGGEVGKSRTEEEKLGLAKELLAKAKEKGVNIMLPEDSLCANTFSNDAEVKTFESANIPLDEMGLDIGPKARKAYKDVILASKTILWNGPMGVFEWSNYENGTKEVAYSVAEATQKNGAYSLIGGGDSVAAINKFELNDQVSYVSTGGGAMLESLEGKVLPGVSAILS
ncbi:MAG: phosphoglycerate kinase [Sphingobacteriales bacterium]|nr:MAG: phosphoglycerate kinase [Sphingobacteriales bacterium]